MKNGLTPGIWKRVEEDQEAGYYIYHMKLMCDCSQPDCGTMLTVEIDGYDTCTPQINMEISGEASAPCKWGEYQFKSYYYYNSSVQDKVKGYLNILYKRFKAAMKLLFTGEVRTGTGQMTIFKPNLKGWILGLQEAYQYYEFHEKRLEKERTKSD